MFFVSLKTPTEAGLGVLAEVFGEHVIGYNDHGAIVKTITPNHYRTLQEKGVAVDVSVLVGVSVGTNFDDIRSQLRVMLTRLDVVAAEVDAVVERMFPTNTTPP